MKATIEVPDDLYRRVKARSAMEARTVREVTVSLYRDWLESAGATAVVEEPAAVVPTWFGAAREYAERVKNHDMTSIRKSISRGRGPAGGR
jgi:hypothetical protein